MAKKKLRYDFETHQGEIMDALIRLTKKYGRIPNQTELANETGFSRVTINKHIKQLKDSDKFKITGMDAIATPKVRASLLNQALKGNVQAIKLWLQFSEGWSEKQEVEHSGEIQAPAPPVILEIKKSKD